MSNLDEHKAEQARLAREFSDAVEDGTACRHCGRYRSVRAHGGCGQMDCISRYFLVPQRSPIAAYAAIYDRLYRMRVSVPDHRTNGRRADEALTLLAAIHAMTGANDTREAMTDVLCQMMHLARMVGLNFSEEVEIARIHFAAEIVEDKDWLEGEPHP